MPRGEVFSNNEFYHVYNRGVDKRDIFDDQYDIDRFHQSMVEFNSIDPIGSIFENSFRKQLGDPTSKLPKNERLVNIVAYCFNPNHYHIILEQLVENGISTFMKRFGGYTMYFNEKYKRSGALFQGKYKVKHINSNEYLLHLSAYVNLNNRVHGIPLGDPTSKCQIRSSWDEYVGQVKNHFCSKDIVLDQFKTVREYEKFALDALELMQEKKKEDKELKSLIMD